MEIAFDPLVVGTSSVLSTTSVVLSAPLVTVSSLFVVCSGFGDSCWLGSLVGISCAFSVEELDDAESLPSSEPLSVVNSSGGVSTGVVVETTSSAVFSLLPSIDETASQF